MSALTNRQLNTYAVQVKIMCKGKKVDEIVFDSILAQTEPRARGVAMSLGEEYLDAMWASTHESRKAYSVEIGYVDCTLGVDALWDETDPLPPQLPPPAQTTTSLWVPFKCPIHALCEKAVELPEPAAQTQIK